MTLKFYDKTTIVARENFVDLPTVGRIRMMRRRWFLKTAKG
jgi:hypothetical protein